MKSFLWRGAFAALIVAGAGPALAQSAGPGQSGGYGSMLPLASPPQRSVPAQQPQYLAVQHQDQLIPPAEPLPGSQAPVGTGAVGSDGMGRSVMEPTPAPDYSRFPGPPAAGAGGYGAAGGYNGASGENCYGGSSYAGAGYGASNYSGYGDGSFVSSGSDCWDDDVYCEPACCGPTIFAGAYALMLTRDRANPTWTSYQTDVLENQMMKTEDASFGYGGGFEVFAGICCGGGWALEGRYWGWFPGQAEANTYDPSGVLADGSDLGVVIPNLDMLVYDDGGGPSGVDTFYQNAARHRIRMENELHNVELNLFNSPVSGGMYDAGVYGAGYAYADCGPGGCGGHAVTMNILGGVRYIKFDESFLFSTDPSDGVFTGAADEVHYNIETENNLIGLQTGGNLSWFATRRWSFNGGAKMGLYVNQMSHEQSIYGINGHAQVGAVGPWAGQAYHVWSDDTRMSFVGELDMSTSYQVFSCMKITGGYRVAAISGVALTENQIPTYFAGLDDVAEIDSNGDLLLHGAYAGVEFCW